jgi:hypothetical protein
MKQASKTPGGSEERLNQTVARAYYRMLKSAVSRARGSAYALAASGPIAAQAPLSSSAAEQLTVLQFVFLTHVGLLSPVPLLLISEDVIRERTPAR